MGFYEREYYREERPGVNVPPFFRTAVGVLMAVTVAVFFADGLLTPQTHDINGFLALQEKTLTEPWNWWRFVTYGFAHGGLWHIVFNMLGLFFFGRDMETLYGRKEFVSLYLLLLAVAGLGWAVVEQLGSNPGAANVVGASGAVSGIVILYALNFPRRTVLLMFVIPAPAWVAGVILVATDAYTALQDAQGDMVGNVAYTAHLSGAAFAFLYFRLRWNFSRFTDGWSLARWSRRPRLRVHEPDRGEAAEDHNEEQELSAEVDRILEKIHRQGEGSLTRRERRTLENASREYQRRRRGR